MCGSNDGSVTLSSPNGPFWDKPRDTKPVTIGRKFLQFHNAMKMNSLSQISDTFGNTIAMPVLFLGHGSPMNAIEENEFVAGFRKIGGEIPTPLVILCVSAH